MIAELTLILLFTWTVGVSAVIWPSHPKGERLFYTYCGQWVLGPIPLWGIWFDAYTAFSLSAVSGPWILIGGLITILIVSIIGEVFSL